MATLQLLAFSISSLNIVHSKEYDVIVMGAGMSGIAAATELCEQGMNPHDILIIEGANYIGGRTKMTEFAGYSLSIGASWLEGACVSCNDSYGAQFEVNPMIQFADRFGIEYVVDDFNSEIYFDPMNPINHTALWDAYDAYDEALACVHAQYIFNTTHFNASKEDDSLRFALENCGWSDLNPYQRFVEWYEWDFECGVSPKQSSAFGTYEIYDVYGPDEIYVIDPRGANGIVVELADDLIENGVKILLEEMVTSISYGDNKVMIRTENDQEYTAKYGIITFSVGVLQSDTIDFIPSLPQWKQEVIDKHMMADYAHIYVQWPYDWWSHISNHSEHLLFIEEDTAYFPWARDLNLDRYFAGSNLWKVDVTDVLARKIQRQSVNETVDEYLNKLSRYFGDAVPQPVNVLISNWTNDIRSFGAFTDWNVGFAVDDWELMARPVDNLYFAGEATSILEYGYVSGAYWEGIRAAHDVYDVYKNTTECGADGECPTYFVCHEEEQMCHRDCSSFAIDEYLDECSLTFAAHVNQFEAHVDFVSNIYEDVGSNSQYIENTTAKVDQLQLDLNWNIVKMRKRIESGEETISLKIQDAEISINDEISDIKANVEEIETTLSVDLARLTELEEQVAALGSREEVASSHSVLSDDHLPQVSDQHYDTLVVVLVAMNVMLLIAFAALVVLYFRNGAAKRFPLVQIYSDDDDIDDKTDDENK